LFIQIILGVPVAAAPEIRGKYNEIKSGFIDRASATPKT